MIHYPQMRIIGLYENRMGKHTYVIGDIHGELEQLKILLEDMQLESDDELYVLGDVVDRGEYPIESLQLLMNLPNCICLAGNHECMALSNLRLLSNEITDDFLDNLSLEAIGKLEDWMRYNGGGTTLSGFMNLSLEERQEILEFMENFELYVELEVCNQKYLLVHGGLDHFSEGKRLEEYTLEDFVWARPDYCVSYYKDTIVVTGHTPTQLILGNDNPGYIYQKYNHIALDCGACFSEQGRLAGICLETGECFYSR